MSKKRMRPFICPKCGKLSCCNIVGCSSCVYEHGDNDRDNVCCLLSADDSGDYECECWNGKYGDTNYNFILDYLLEEQQRLEKQLNNLKVNIASLEYYCDKNY